MPGVMESSSRVMDTRRRFREIYGLPMVTHDYGSMRNFANAHREYIRQMKEQQRAKENAAAQRRTMEAFQWAQHYQNMMAPFLTAENQQGPQETQSAAAQTTPTVNDTIQFEPAPFLRRLLAEFIDFLFFLSFKIFVIGALIETDLLDLRSLGQALEDDQDMMQFINLAQELLPVEIVCKVFCCILEGIIMANGLGPIGSGQTPGKWIVGIRVISCRQVTSGATPDQIVVEAPNLITWQQSIKRSFMKNVVVNSLLPLSTAAFQVTNGRVFYDLIVKTVVIMDV